jgi:hypothetical protein
MEEGECHPPREVRVHVDIRENTLREIRSLAIKKVGSGTLFSIEGRGPETGFIHHGWA